MNSFRRFMQQSPVELYVRQRRRWKKRAVFQKNARKCPKRECSRVIGYWLSWSTEPEKEGIMPKQNYLCIQRSQPGKGEKPEFTDPAIVLNPEDDGVDQSIHPEKETADGLIRQSRATDVIEFSEGKLVLVRSAPRRAVLPAGRPLARTQPACPCRAKWSRMCRATSSSLSYSSCWGSSPCTCPQSVGPWAPRWAISVRVWGRWGRPIIAPICRRGVTP